jgi:cell wall assembly regulator SMI1
VSSRSSKRASPTPSSPRWRRPCRSCCRRRCSRSIRWRDGTAAAEGESLNTLTFFPGFYFPSLEEAVQIYHERKDSPQWRGGWFPVFADGAGDFYIVPCESTRKDSAGVIGFIHGEPDQPVEYESLTTMLQTIAACYAQGAFFVDDDGCLEIDDDAHHRIANRFNPEIPEWQS